MRRNPPQGGTIFGRIWNCPNSTELTKLLKAWTEGDAAALDQLLESVYPELRRIARRFMRNEREGQTFQATALVNEAYLRLVDVKNVDWQHRGQFFALSAQIMRRILVDGARARGCGKRGAGAVKVNIDDAGVFSTEPGEAILALDSALSEFAALAPRQRLIAWSITASFLSSTSRAIG